MSTVTVAAAPGGLRRLWDRQLPHYPDTARRMWYLGVTIVATIALYYALFIQGAVAPKIIAQYHFSFTEFVGIVAIGATFGAFASLAAGLADRWGRANLVVGGLLVTGLLVAFAMPNASGKAQYAVCYALVSMVEGICLVATPALIRDFSPQVGRAAAMAFWTMGPVLGSLVVTEVSSHTLPGHPDWRYQFQLCGVVGLVVSVIALIGLRELSPRLRDQLMVSLRDRALVEARAAGIDPDSRPEGALAPDAPGQHHRLGVRDQLVPGALLRPHRVRGGVLGHRVRLLRVAGERRRELVLDHRRDHDAGDRVCLRPARSPQAVYGRGRRHQPGGGGSAGCGDDAPAYRLLHLCPVLRAAGRRVRAGVSRRGWPGSPRRWRSGTRPRRRPGWRCGAG